MMYSCPLAAACLDVSTDRSTGQAVLHRLFEDTAVPGFPAHFPLITWFFLVRRAAGSPSSAVMEFVLEIGGAVAAKSVVDLQFGGRESCQLSLRTANISIPGPAAIRGKLSHDGKEIGRWEFSVQPLA